MAKELLIIFYRNPELGKVKTRLAATLGEGRALAIYLLLVKHTREITESLPVDKVVYYSTYVDTEDAWLSTKFQKRLQSGIDLGQRMHDAFEYAFRLGYEKVCIIGTDCFELDKSTIEEAFNALEKNDAVIGPAKDGGYYLLGTREFMPNLFVGKYWSTSSVFEETTNDLTQKGLLFKELPLLTDIDREENLSVEILTKIKGNRSY